MSRQLPAGIDALLGDGDGTVPYLSAIPIELSHGYRESFIAERHGSLQNNRHVLNDMRNSAALERYATLIGEEGSPILGDETALGLPVVVKERV